jgi:hypothetical protein
VCDGGCVDVERLMDIEEVRPTWGAYMLYNIRYDEEARHNMQFQPDKSIL